MDINEFRREIREKRECLQQEFLSLAGDDLDAMLVSRSATESFLQHPDKSRRLAALWILANHWPSDETTREKFQEVIARDDDVEVRAVAAGRLGEICKDSQDDRIGKYLATLVVDKNEHIKVREEAYRALYWVVGISVFDHPLLVDFDFPKNADRKFISSFLGRDVGPELT